MTHLAAVALVLAVVGASALLHYEVLAWRRWGCGAAQYPIRQRVLRSLAAVFASHLAQIALFAALFALLAHWGLGELHGEYPDSRLAWVYFSAETYTSLGFGDLYPVGPMRLLVGIEALTGLLMIGWSASSTWEAVSRFHPKHGLKRLRDTGEVQ